MKENKDSTEEDLRRQIRELKSNGANSESISEQKKLIQQLQNIKEKEITKLSNKMLKINYSSCRSSPRPPKKENKIQTKRKSHVAEEGNSEITKEEMKLDISRSNKRFSTQIVDKNKIKNIVGLLKNEDNKTLKKLSKKEGLPPLPKKIIINSPSKRAKTSKIKEEPEKEFVGEEYSTKFKAGIEYSYKEDMNKNAKEAMEDKGYSAINFMNNPNEAFFCLFDGHGGDEVSKYLQQNFAKCYKENLINYSGDIEKAILRTFEHIDKDILHLNINGVGSTGVAVHLIKENNSKITVFSGNVGDSRSYIFSLDHHEMLTFDHRANNINEKLRIVKNGGFIENDRVDGVLMLSRSLGDNDLKNSGVIATPYIHFTEVNLKEPNQYLIIASDGIWDIFNENEIKDILKENINNTTLDICKQIIQKALDKDAWDNLSIFVAKLS